MLGLRYQLFLIPPLMLEAIHCLNKIYRCLWMHLKHARIGIYFGQCHAVTSGSLFWSSVVAERNTLSSSDPLVFTSADILVYVGRICHFFLHRCGRKTTSSPDHCFNVLFPACVIFVDPVSWGASAVAEGRIFCGSAVAASKALNSPSL